MPSNQGYQKVAQESSAGLAVADDRTTAYQKMDKNESESSGSNLPSTHSSQQLMPAQDAESSSINNGDRQNRGPPLGLGSVSLSSWFTIGVLCFVNLINYMDRFTVAGVLSDVQSYFNVGDDKAGFLQTAFVLSYMLCAPLFGYLGDRYSRRWIMIVGVALWSGTTLIGSYMLDFSWFLVFRALVGIGEASYSTIAPTIISDLFVHDLRSKMLAVFYFAIPVGSGLGYIIGAQTASLLGSWRWALRVTPVLGVIAIALIYFTKDPARGESEGSHSMEQTSYVEDLKGLRNNRSFMLSTLGFTCVAFVAGALAWWGPKFIHQGMKLQPGNSDIKLNDVSFKFGAITMLSGILGVPLGSYLSTRLVKRYPRVDPIICGIGLLLSAPFLTLTIFTVQFNSTITYVCIFFGELALNLNWAIVADILLYVVIPTRRSTAEAFQILISHALGDAGSPYIVGVISEALKRYYSANAIETVHILDPAINGTLLSPVNQISDLNSFKSLQYALLSTCVVEVIGAALFFCTALYIVRDKRRVENIIAENQSTEPHHIYADAPAPII